MNVITQIAEKIARVTGLQTMDVFALIFTVWAIIDIRWYIRKKRSLSVNQKLGVFLVIFVALLAIASSVLFHSNSPGG